MKRRRRNILLGMALVCLLAALAIPAMQGASEYWSGYRSLDVNVRVTDAENSRPISDAVLTVFDDPVSPEEGRVPTLDSRAHRLESFATNAEGLCRFEHRFRAGGSWSRGRSQGFVDLSRTWIKVSAPGRKSTFVPLDHKSTSPRNPDDQTPIVTTVALSKGVD
jgi:hypothetical protein